MSDDEDAAGGADDPSVAIVGGGITGLSTLHALDERGVDAVAFEATDEVGGVVQSRDVDGKLLEVGPQRLRLTDAIRAMVTDLDIADELITVDDDLPLFVYADGKLREVPRSLSAFRRTDLLSTRAKLRLLAEPLTDPIDPEETAQDAFVRKFGAETYTNLIAPLFGGTYGSDPAEMPARHALEPMMGLESRKGSLLRAALSRLVFSNEETPPAASFESGLQRLPEALAEAYADRLHRETPVTAIERAGAGSDAEWLVHTDDDTRRVDHVVVTTPAAETADLVEGVDAESAAALREFNYNPLVLVHLESAVRADGFGYQVRRTEPMRTLGVTWNTSLFDRDGVYTAFLGGMHDPEAIERDDETLGGTAAEEFERVMGVDAEVLHVERMPRAFPAWDDSWAACERVDLPEGITLATNYTGRMGLPSRVREARRLAGELSNALGE
ncbi:protoporphyrinogen oxidase [Halolamina rubra]|uniref:protoporphyrinogen oxidase n=1 Tax=Halolamina rubra TaxID=1380430 RepID=UPI000678A055|nr:protoporphyrinogen oxidase [Halolamina rubra]